MIYTAISRAKYTDQVVLIDSNKKNKKDILKEMENIILKHKIREFLECKCNCK